MDKKNNKNWLNNPNIKNLSLSNVMENAFGRYAKYVIQERALPDVRDGLKPVQRRILFAMNNLGLYNTRPYKKSARTVGEVIGKYHPHGDSSIYEAMVRMSQDWKNNSCLIDMQGNNGSIDGDSAAAMRYTECRLSPIAMEMLNNLDKNTVEWVLNFDDSEKEPTVLPSFFPNLLINGTTGIAAGYATNMPPHNPIEILNGLKFLLKNPNASLEEIMKIIPGPDFPTAGVINGISGIYDAYQTGKGKLELNSNYEIRGENKHFYEIAITNIPFDIKKSDLVRQIATIAYGEQIDGIESVIDESDQEGINIILHIKKDKDIETIMGYLFKKTALFETFAINNTVIANKKPVCLGLKELLNEHLNHCFNVLIKSSTYDLNKAKQKLEIVQGLITCISILDEVIILIRMAQSKIDAKEKLMSRFNFTDVQAEAILNMKLYRLTNTDVNELKKDKEILVQNINELELLINHKDKQIEKLTSIFDQYILNFGFPRKTIINQEVKKFEINSKNLISNEKFIFGISRFGYLKLLSPRSWNQEKSLNEYSFNNEKDSLIYLEQVFNLDTIVIITKFGKLVSLPIHKIKPSKVKEKGFHINDFVTLSSDDQIIGAFLLSNDQMYYDKNLVMITKTGTIKTTNFSELVTKQNLKTTSIIKLEKNDELLSFNIVNNDKNYIVNTISSFGNITSFLLNEVPVQSRSSSGVNAMKLKDNDVIVGMTIVENNEANWIIFSDKNYQIINQQEINITKRNSVGKQLLDKRINSKNIIAAYNFDIDDTYVAKTTTGSIAFQINKLKLNIANSYADNKIYEDICKVQTTKKILIK